MWWQLQRWILDDITAHSFLGVLDLQHWTHLLDATILFIVLSLLIMSCFLCSEKGLSAGENCKGGLNFLWPRQKKFMQSQIASTGSIQLQPAQSVQNFPLFLSCKLCAGP
jgi:hypothetical protein